MRRDNDIMIPVDDALGIVEASLHRLDGVSDCVSLADALGRIISEDQFSRLSLPPFDKSAMDGYAIAEGDDREQYNVVGIVAAGDGAAMSVVAGTCLKVMTGAPVPEGTGKVIMLEDTVEEQEIVRIIRRRSGTHICRKGEDIRIGQRVLSSGKRLNAADIANLVACGLSSVDCVAPIRLSILSTGNEIVTSTDRIEPGKIMDANGPLLESLAQTFGMDVVRRSHVGDDVGETAKWIHSALSESDLVLVSGGVSEGDFDTVCPALRALGATIHFSRVAMKPGKPTVFATLGSKVIFGLPGNPVSVHLAFHLFVLRAVSVLLGSELFIHEYLLEIGTDYTRKNTERAQFVPCRLNRSAKPEPVEFHGSAHLAAISATDGYAMVPVGINTVKKGETVRYLSLRDF